MANFLKVNNPATGEFITTVRMHTKEEIKQAIKNGHESFKKWKKINAHERTKLLKNWSKKSKKTKKR